MTAFAFVAKDLGVSERTLRRAVNEGTLRATRPSPRKLDLPFSEERYAREHWPLIAKLREALRTEHNVRFAMLFGSTARGEETERSDVDVIVDLRDPDFMREIDLEIKLEGIVGRSVDVVGLKRAEEDPTFLAMALEDGRALVDRGDVWQRLRAEETGLRRRGRRHDLRRRREALARVDRFLEEQQWSKTA
jgi:predicted nucleotidyltransferase